MATDSDLGPGAYGLIFKISHKVTISTGRLGVAAYRAGWYVYVGSAMGGLSGRIRYHLRAQKRGHWHIDRLLPLGELTTVVAAETERRLECPLAAFLALRFPVVRRFGSSDCRCPGHLFRNEARAPLLDAMQEAVRAAGCRPQVMRRRRLSTIRAS